MNLKDYILKNDIKQIIISNGIFHVIYPKIKDLELKINHDNKSLNTLFCGLYEVRDIEKLKNFEGPKWILWTGVDSNSSLKNRYHAIQFIKSLLIKGHLVYDDQAKNNLEKQNIKSTKIKINENAHLSIKAYVKHIFKYEYFSNIRANFYHNIKENLLNILLCINELSNNENINYNFAILEKIDTAIITKFGLEGKIVFINETCNYPNCVYYSNYLELIKKIYYYSINNLKEIIKNSFIKYIKSNIPDKTIVYIPIWKRHNLLSKCIDSIKNQTVDVNILGVCSLYEDARFCKKNNINYILVNNSMLGQKFQFGMEFCKLFFPKNVIIMGSDDIMTRNYIKIINYYDKYDIVGYKTWRVLDINKNQELKLSYDHSVTEKNGKKYWGNNGLAYKCNFNSEYYGFPKDMLSESPYMIGAGRSVGYKYLNKNNWEVYQIYLKKYLDTNSLFKMLILNNANFKLLKYFDECIISLKDYNLEMITPLDDYKCHKNIKVIESK